MHGRAVIPTDCWSLPDFLAPLFFKMVSIVPVHKFRTSVMEGHKNALCKYISNKEVVFSFLANLDWKKTISILTISLNKPYSKAQACCIMRLLTSRTRNCDGISLI